MYPANLPVPSLISVAATNDYDNLASFSNYGRSYVHVAAPGVAILSTVPNNSYRYLSGTSMAAPFVAGMAAMMFREASNLSGYQIKNLIISSVNTVSSLSSKIYSGGRVNEYNAISSAQASVALTSSQPVYVASAPAGAREPASESKGGGCGLVSTLSSGLGAAGGGSSAMIVVILAAPLLVLLALRSRKTGKEKRKYDRFKMNSDIKLSVGGRELSGQVRTISEGGLSFCADSMLEKGGIITMKISSPDGTEQIEVQGHVVWSESNQAYGVQFDQAKEGVVESIRNWSARLVRSN